MAKVQRGKYTMRGAHWMPVSSLAKQLVARCLQKANSMDFYYKYILEIYYINI